jgi:beta-glucosidase
MKNGRERPARRWLAAAATVVAGATVAVAGSVAGCGDGDQGCPDIRTRDPDSYPGLDPGIECRASALLADMTLEEKVAQMHGTGILPEDDLWTTPGNERLSIPGFYMVDGPRGVHAGFATAFPVGMARGATWDPALERRVGAAMGLEVAAKGGNVLLAPCINVLRHPRWGRAQETYGEDPHHLGRMGVAFIQGAQEHVLASVKHFAANSMEDNRFDVDVSLDERTLREIYLPHFRAAVQEARVASVMSAYNSVNGAYCGENAALLTDILKGEWEFDGFVESDWIFGTYSTVPSALAGLDIEMPAPVYYGPALQAAVESGEVPEAVVDEAVRRILRKKIEFGLADPPTVSPDVVESPEHVALAREVAEKAIVLLRNENTTLPLDEAGLTTVAVVGHLADTVNLGDRGSSQATPSAAVTPLAGIRALVNGSVDVLHFPADTLAPADATALAAADAVVVVVGLTNDDEGENTPVTGGDRETLALSPERAALIADAAALNPRTIVVLEGGSAIAAPWIDQAGAVLMAWYPGMEGGHAIADVLFGRVNPSGRLPLSWPVDESGLPPFLNDADAVTYGYYHGYRLLDRDGLEPLFPFGHGLSYTTFSYDAIALDADTLSLDDTLGLDDTLVVIVDLSNTGDRAGEEVVQLYVGANGSSVDRPMRDLRAFARVALEPGASTTVELRVAATNLAIWDVATSAWVVEPLQYTAYVGPSCRDLPLTADFDVF